ncbi:methionyl-tRNA formyltransferase [Agromyces atrinae]|uniref:Methionyl-tRNA formyltransferase n=1 Tax=Agromyces atrinae TaxID=592376 RepID=A0A4Q2M417_9MICO|nr:methionyl-tRNA formyltransferase [Agromyces atrinae]NYD66268.1 methionyl-tRNA formyltransferase [Agromyces atrinae]RXZ86599.1 methionyl-tRNA formyltransferase [Agromyces atrinae]
MRLIFAGTPAVAVPSLDALVAGPHEVVAVVTRPDAPLGRKRVLTPSPVAARAAELGIPVVRAARLDEAATTEIVAFGADLGVIVAYGGLVREPLLSAPRHGWINLHFSLLPRWRGAAPVQHAIIAGDATTGAAVFQLVPGLDAGAVFDEITRDVGADETAGELLDALSYSGAALLASVVDEIAAGTAVAREQEGEPTLAPKLGQDDARLDWTAPFDEVYNRFRGVTPEPGAFTTIAGNRLKVLEARAAADDAPDLEPGALLVERSRVLVGTGSRPLELLRVQAAGKPAAAAADWGRGLPPGTERLDA